MCKTTYHVAKMSLQCILKFIIVFGRNELCFIRFTLAVFLFENISANQVPTKIQTYTMF